jgi:hypothetical protein
MTDSESSHVWTILRLRRSQAMSEPEMRNPFRSEADAFRVLVIIVIAAAIVISAAELIATWLGVTLALIAIALGLWQAVGWLRVGLGEREADPPDQAEPPPG